MATNERMSNSCLELNEYKTEILPVGPKTGREIPSNNLEELAPWIKSKVTRLGVIDPNVSFKSYINTVSKKIIFNLRKITKVQLFINQKDTKVNVIHFSPAN